MFPKVLKLNRLVVMISLAFLSVSITAKECVVRHPSKQSQQDTRHEYPIALLSLLLELTKSEYGDCTLKGIGALSQKRQVLWLQENKALDIAWLPVSEELNNRLQAIPIPIRKGFLGWRLLLIHENNKDVFKNLRNLSDLQAYSAGFGSSWVDLAVMEHNFKTVVTGTSYDGLFDMLSRSRFDFFSRAVYEAFDETNIRSKTHPQLIIEPHIAMHYRQADFFYLEKSNTDLKNRLEAGFRLAFQSGVFEKFFYEYYGDYLLKANMQNRTIIELDNPFLPENVPVDDPQLWFNLNVYSNVQGVEKN